MRPRHRCSNGLTEVELLFPPRSRLLRLALAPRHSSRHAGSSSPRCTSASACESRPSIPSAPKPACAGPRPRSSAVAAVVAGPGSEVAEPGGAERNVARLQRRVSGTGRAVSAMCRRLLSSRHAVGPKRRRSTRSRSCKTTLDALRRGRRQCPCDSLARVRVQGALRHHQQAEWAPHEDGGGGPLHRRERQDRARRVLSTRWVEGPPRSDYFCGCS